MSRTPTETSNTLQWTERATDSDTTSLNLSLVLDAVDDGTGFTNDGRDSSNIGWLSFSKTENNFNAGEGVEALIDITANKSGLTQGYTYRFKITADDGTTAVDRTFTLTVREPIIDGTKILYVDNGGSLRRDSVSPAFDVTGISNDVTASIPSQSFAGSEQSAQLTRDGKNLYISNQSPDPEEIHWWTLATAWDPSTLQYEGYNTWPQDLEFVNDFYIRPTGEDIYFVDSFNDEIKSYSVDAGPHDVTGGFTQKNTANFTSGNGINYRFCFSPDGLNIYYESGQQHIGQQELATPWDITSATNFKDFNVGNDLDNNSIQIAGDGTKLFIDSGTGSTVIAWDFGTPFDVSTLQNKTTGNTSQGSQSGVFFGVK